ncbi:hypothetical protein [Roseomonas sp. BN140053]|uniref:hypothetical protein n=1 Tax=Roseomonas sp. BN140053 TaxID=3391898 RepID=UPI0039E807A9
MSLTRLTRRILPAAAALLLSATGLATAGQQDFALSNRSGYRIATVEVSPSSSRNWGPDILGQDVLDNGRTLNVSFPNNTSACAFDLRVTFSDGDQGTLSNVDLCSVSAISVAWRNNRAEFTTR